MGDNGKLMVLMAAVAGESWGCWAQIWLTSGCKLMGMREGDWWEQESEEMEKIRLR